MKPILFIPIFAFVMQACQTVVDVKIPLEERRLVVNALFNPDSVWSAQISLSRHVLDDGPFSASYATITIIDPVNNSVVEQLQQQQNNFGIYKGSLKPVAEKEYLIRATGPNGTVEARSMAPSSVPITKIEIDSTVILSNSFDLDVPVKIHFKDPGGTKNYYRIMFLVKSFHVYQKDTIWYNQYVHPYIDNSSIDGENNQLISDTFFDGKDHVLSPKINRYYFFSGQTVGLSAILHNLSESYYQYATTQSLQNYTQGDPFAQPVLVYNNIQNGFGIFAGYSQSVKVLGK